jgi:fructokinase
VFFFDRVTPAALRLAKEYRNKGTIIFFEPYNLKRLEELTEAIGICHILKFSNNLTKKDVYQLMDDTTLLEKIKSYRPNLIIQTLGEHGLFYNYPGSEKWHYTKGKKLEKVFDTCGAGDWLTTGFLFYLQELTAKNRIRLIDTLNSAELVKSALDFSQMLASLSSMFVGARGLSKLLEKNEILNITEDYIKKNSEIIPSVEYSTGPNTQANRIINADAVPKNYCPTCLLEKQL